MLQAEDNLTEGSGVLLSNTRTTLGLQTLHVFQSLGHRVTSLEAKPLGMAFTSFLAFPATENLTRGQVLNKAEEEDFLEMLARSLVQLPPNAQTIVVLPTGSREELLQNIFSLTKNGTIFLVPTLFGLGDAGLLEQSLDFWNKYPRRFLELKKNIPPHLKSVPTELSFVGDVATFLMSAAGKKNMGSKLLQIPPNIHSLDVFFEQFQRAFSSTHDSNSSFLQGCFINPFRMRSQKKHFFDFWTSEQQRTRPQNTRKIKIENALDYFPTKLSSPERILNRAAQLVRNNATEKNHFPHRRAL